MIIIDAKKLACPAPVLKTKKALEETSGVIQILVDNIAARENVKRFATAKKCSIEIEDQGDDNFKLTITPSTNNSDTTQEQKENINLSSKVIYITDDKVGEDKELGKILLKGFIHTIKESEILPSKIIFVNRGVFVTCEWEDSIEDLKELSKMGIEIYSCGTCLNYFEITEKLKIGVIGNAYDTVSALLEADSVARF